MDKENEVYEAKVLLKEMKTIIDNLSKELNYCINCLDNPIMMLLEGDKFFEKFEKIPTYFIALNMLLGNLNENKNDNKEDKNNG